MPATVYKRMAHAGVVGSRLYGRRYRVSVRVRVGVEGLGIWVGAGTRIRSVYGDTLCVQTYVQGGTYVRKLYLHILYVRVSLLLYLRV